MLSRDLRAFAAPRARYMTVIWGACLVAPVIYTYVIHNLGSGGEWDGTVAADMPIPAAVAGEALAVLGLLVAAASFLYPRWALGPERLAKAPRSYGTGPGRELIDGMSETDRRAAALLAYYQTTMIVVWSLREALAVFGVVAAILRTDTRTVVPFAVAALVLVALARPRPYAFLESVRGR